MYREKGRITRKSIDRGKPWQKGYMTERRGNKYEKGKEEKCRENKQQQKTKAKKIWVKK